MTFSRSTRSILWEAPPPFEPRIATLPDGRKIITVARGAWATTKAR